MGSKVSGYIGLQMFKRQLSMEIAKSPEYFACPDCDALFVAPNICEGERVICPRCRANLFSRRPNFVHRASALVVAAAFFFILANAFPFLTLRANYRQSYMHLAGCVSGLEKQGFPVLAAMVGVFTLGAPIYARAMPNREPHERVKRIPGQK